MKKQSVAKFKKYTPEIVEMMDATTSCLNCGTLLKYSKNKEKRRNRGYCCLDCFYAKPPKMAWLEQKYKKPAKKIITDLLNKNNNIFLTAQLLDIGPPTLYDWLRKLHIERIVRWK